MGNSILMIMECKSQYRERKANEEEINKFSVHQANNLPTMQREANGVQAILFEKAYCIFILKNNIDCEICKSIYSFLYEWLLFEIL